MSWQDKLRDVEFTILTGEGSLWTPKWAPGSRSVDLNNTIYDYPNLRGSYVDQREAKGEKYVLDFVFDGENAVDNGNAFLTAAKDKRPWTVTHPYYGRLTVHPVSISQDDSSYNASKFKVQAINTTLDEAPETIAGIRGTLTELKGLTDASIAAAYVAGLPSVGAADAALMAETVGQWDDLQSTYVKSADDLARLKNEVREAATAADNLIADAQAGIRTFTSLLDFPFTVGQNLSLRFDSFVDQVELLKNKVTGISSASDKQFFTAAASALISTSALVSVLEPELERSEDTAETDEDATQYTLAGDYASRADLLAQIEKINAFYNDFTEYTDGLTTDRADGVESFAFDGSTSSLLSQLVYFSIRNIERQISGAKQEREIILAKDTDVINLAHKYLGAATEANIDTLINLNGYGLNEMQEVPAGSTFIYYT